MITLTVWERVQLESLVRSQRGDVGLIIDMISIADKLSLSVEEVKEIELTVDDKGTFWQHEKDTPIDFTDDEEEMLGGLVNNHTNWPIDTRVIGMSRKFKR